MVLRWPEHQTSHLHSRQEAAVTTFILFYFILSEKQELSQKIPNRLQPECVSGPLLASTEVFTVSSGVKSVRVKRIIMRYVLAIQSVYHKLEKP